MKPVECQAQVLAFNIHSLLLLCSNLYFLFCILVLCRQTERLIVFITDLSYCDCFLFYLMSILIGTTKPVPGQCYVASLNNTLIFVMVMPRINVWASKITKYTCIFITILPEACVRPGHILSRYSV